MSVARNILKQPKLVPGGGATELTVSATLKQKSSSIEGIEKVNFFFLFWVNYVFLSMIFTVLFPRSYILQIWSLFWSFI